MVKRHWPGISNSIWPRQLRAMVRDRMMTAFLKSYWPPLEYMKQRRHDHTRGRQLGPITSNLAPQRRNRDDLLTADCVVSFTEAPRSSNSRGGRHVEHGMAVALGKRIVVVGHRENVFHCLPEVEFFQAWQDARHALSHPNRSTP